MFQIGEIAGFGFCTHLKMVIWLSKLQESENSRAF